MYPTPNIPPPRHGYNLPMIHLILGLLVFAIGCGGGGGTDASKPSLAAPTAKPTLVSEKHLIYLHGKIIEDQGPRPTHPRFGTYEYQEILDTFAAAGFEVTSDQRPTGTRPSDHARITASQVRQLLDSGVPAGDITVVGFSKGGVIAVLTALELDEPQINFVFIACCGPWIDDVFAGPDDVISGRMLSIYEASDNVGSCGTLFDRARTDSTTEEVEVNLGTGHGAFYRPHSEWVDPVVRWAQRKDPKRSHPAN